MVSTAVTCAPKTRIRNWSSDVPVEFLVINTGPLILLGKANALEVVGQLPFQFICPTAVRAELDTGVAQGYPDIRPSWLQVSDLSAPLSSLAKATLDEGEAEVIQFSVGTRISSCLSRWIYAGGVMKAMASGLQSVVGVLGLLAMAKTLRVVPAALNLSHHASSGKWHAWYSAFGYRSPPRRIR